jgi:4a-hydroxytetrahydrobiopterin dehydratase
VDASPGEVLTPVMAYTEISAEAVSDDATLGDWRVVLGSIEATFAAGSFPAAAALVAAIVEVAEAADHHPDLQVRYPGDVRVTLTTHATGGLTTHDVDLARRISQLTTEAGAPADPSVAQQLELAIDTTDADRIRPFWAAVLDYRDDAGVLVDPRGVGPALWFQRMEGPRTQRGRFHLDVSVPHDEADRRVAAAVAAGGRLVEDRYARAWWVLADPDGNEACVCTWQDRDRTRPGPP